MIPAQFTRIAQIVLLAAALTALVAPSLARGGPSVGPPADAFERYAAAHPYGEGALHPQALDAFERYAAHHATTSAIDGRSPDVRDLATPAQLQTFDRRSPDTTEVSFRPAVGSPTVAEPRGFDWDDAGVGAIATLTMLGLVGGAMLLLARLHRRQRMHVT